MKLPHGETMHYAKELISKDELRAEVAVVFPQLPTLAMFIEAAAQSSSVFQEGNEAKIGFVSMAQNVKLLAEISEQNYSIKVSKEVELGAYKKFSFEAYGASSSLLVVTGKFTLVIE